LNVRDAQDYGILLLYFPENSGKEAKFCTIFLFPGSTGVLQGKDLASRASGQQNASSSQQEAHKPGKAGFGRLARLRRNRQLFAA
jgi:hypothetical protein